MDESSSQLTHKYCGTCGQTFEPTVSFCPSDGTKLEGVGGNFVGEIIKVRATGTHVPQRLDATAPEIPRPHVTDPSIPKPHVTDPSIPRPHVTDPSVPRTQIPAATKTSDLARTATSNQGTDLSNDTTRQVTLPRAPYRADDASTVITTNHPVVPKQQEKSFEELIGTTIDHQYELLEIIGTGGMSVVFKARHALLNRTVAIKTLRPHLMMHPQSLLRFQQEAKAASNLRHKNVIYIHGFGTMGDDKPYLVMDYVEGVSLADVIQAEGHLKPARAIAIFVQLTDALEHAHKVGIIHRDLKPSNILLVQTKDADGSEEELVYIVDFGIAKLLPQEGSEALSLTQTGEVFGSPLYMSPEQCRGDKIDHRADIYSLGCLMYETLTGRTPITGENTMDVLLRHTTDMPPSMTDRNVRVAAGLERIVLKCLVKDPNQRYQSMGKILADLNSYSLNESDSFAMRLARKIEILFLKRRTRTWREHFLIALAVFGPLLAIGFYLSYLINDWDSVNKRAAATELLFDGDAKTAPERKHEAVHCTERARWLSNKVAATTNDLDRHNLLLTNGRVCVEGNCPSLAGFQFTEAAILSEKLNGPFAIPTLMEWLDAGDNYAKVNFVPEALRAYRKLIYALVKEQDEFDGAHVSLTVANLLYQQRRSAEAMQFFSSAYREYTNINPSKRKHFIFIPPSNMEQLLASEEFGYMSGRMGICRRRLLASQEAGSTIALSELGKASEDFLAAYKAFKASKSASKNEAASLANFLATTSNKESFLFAEYPHLVNVAEQAYGGGSAEYATVLIQYANQLWQQGNYWDAFQMHDKGARIFKTLR